MAEKNTLNLSEVGKQGSKAASSSHWARRTHELCPPVFSCQVVTLEDVAYVHCVLYGLYAFLSCRLNIERSNEEAVLAK